MQVRKVLHSSALVNVLLDRIPAHVSCSVPRATVRTLNPKKPKNLIFFKTLGFYQPQCA